MNVLLSMKPKYVEKVLSGDKRYEFRKRGPSQNIIWEEK
jgi:predicted transcriptional regulator